MEQIKIDWCDCTVNPVENWNEPQFFPDRLKQLDARKSKSIFMDSMSDIGRWKTEWVDETISAMNKNLQHRYIFLSKVPNAYNHLFWYSEEAQIYCGYSITKQQDLEKIIDDIAVFLSIEPILEPIDISNITSTLLGQIIIGAETGNRKDKVIPKKEWIDSLVKQADELGIRVFMKSSLKELMGNDFRQDTLIWDD